MARFTWLLFITLLLCLEHDHGLVDGGCVVEKIKGWFKKAKNVFKKPENNTVTVPNVENFTASSRQPENKTVTVSDVENFTESSSQPENKNVIVPDVENFTESSSTTSEISK